MWATVSISRAPRALQLSAVLPVGPVTTAAALGSPPGFATTPDAVPAGETRSMIWSAERLDTANSAPFGLIDRKQGSEPHI